MMNRELIILFGQDGNGIIECDSNQSESTIYLESVTENKLFISLHWKNEPFNTFISKIPMLKERKVLDPRWSQLCSFTNSKFWVILCVPKGSAL